MVRLLGLGPTFKLCSFSFQELELGGGRFQKLQWKSYKVLSRYLSGAGSEQCTDFDVNNQSTFPALHFSPVKSYITETTSALT